MSTLFSAIIFADSKIELIESEVKGKGDSEAVIAAIRGYAPSEEL